MPTEEIDGFTISGGEPFDQPEALQALVREIRLRFDSASLQKLAAGNWDTVQIVLERIYSSLKIGGVALVGLAVNLMLAPVVMFYLLLDWHGMTARMAGVIPRPWHGKLISVARDIDAVLSQYLRGQILVMAILAAYYCLALWLADIPSSLSIGVFTGLLIFIPYLGFATGMILALLVATLQFAGWGPIIAVLVVYGIGQLLESFILTPFLVGERIGLHPLAVIFALMAFGQLFGFFGVLHTWGRDPMQFHPHVHFVVPGGAVSSDRTRWLATPQNFLFLHAKMCSKYKTYFRARMQQLGLLDKIPSSVWSKKWVVDVEPVGNGEAVLKYLAPYVYRVAISDKRILDCTPNGVTYAWKPSKSNRWRKRTVPGDAVSYTHLTLPTNREV